MLHKSATWVKWIKVDFERSSLHEWYFYSVVPIINVGSVKFFKLCGLVIGFYTEKHCSKLNQLFFNDSKIIYFLGWICAVFNNQTCQRSNKEEMGMENDICWKNKF